MLRFSSQIRKLSRATFLNMNLLPSPFLPSTLQLFEDLDDVPLDSQDVTGANHCPYLHLAAHFPPHVPTILAGPADNRLDMKGPWP